MKIIILCLENANIINIWRRFVNIYYYDYSFLNRSKTKKSILSKSAGVE